MSLPSSFVIILSTFPTDQDPLPLARTLVDEKLVACVNILPPMQSLYRWEGKLEHSAEHQLVMKTTVERVEGVKARLITLHPYDIPEVLVLPITAGGEAYLKWLAASVRDV